MAESWRNTEKKIRNAVYKRNEQKVAIPLSPPDEVSKETLKVKSL